MRGSCKEKSFAADTRFQPRQLAIAEPNRGNKAANFANSTFRITAAVERLKRAKGRPV